MPQLSHTRNLSQGRLFDSKDEKAPLGEIHVIGDGNCAYGAVALGLIDLIRSDDAKLKNVNINSLIAAMCTAANLQILQQRLASYTKDNYPDLATPLKNVIDFITNPGNQTAAEFISYVKKSNSRHEIAALHVALAPALRAMACEQFAKAPQLNPVLAVADINLTEQKKDNVDAEAVVVGQLEEVLNITIALKQVNKKQECRTATASLSAPDHIKPNNPTITILHSEDNQHFNYLSPTTEKASLWNCLRTAQKIFFDEKSYQTGCDKEYKKYSNKNQTWVEMAAKAPELKEEKSASIKSVQYATADNKNKIVSEAIQKELDEKLAWELQQQEFTRLKR